MNEDGCSATISVYSGPAEPRALKTSISESDLTPLQVSLVESQLDWSPVMRNSGSSSFVFESTNCYTNNTQ